MIFFKCPKCGVSISDNPIYCPKCHTNMQNYLNKIYEEKKFEYKDNFDCYSFRFDYLLRNGDRDNCYKLHSSGSVTPYKYSVKDNSLILEADNGKIYTYSIYKNVLIDMYYCYDKTSWSPDYIPVRCDNFLTTIPDTETFSGTYYNGHDHAIKFKTNGTGTRYLTCMKAYPSTQGTNPIVYKRFGIFLATVMTTRDVQHDEKYVICNNKLYSSFFVPKVLHADSPYKEVIDDYNKMLSWIDEMQNQKYISNSDVHFAPGGAPCISSNAKNSSSNTSVFLSALAIIIAVLIFYGFIKGIANECSIDGCHNKRWRSSSYCEKHDPFYDGTIIYEQNHKNNSYSNGSSKKTSQDTTTNSSTKTTSTYSKTNSSNKKSMPDCDDYDSYEDFMDDWDGYMPDGSDAEDYWENW